MTTIATESTEAPAFPAAGEPALGVSVNGQPHRIPAGTALADLLAAIGLAPDAVATAVNGDFVARGLRSTRRLRDGDQVTCFEAIVGG